MGAERQVEARSSRRHLPHLLLSLLLQTQLVQAAQETCTLRLHQQQRCAIGAPAPVNGDVLAVSKEAGRCKHPHLCRDG